MLRIIAGVIVGWIVMAVLVMATFGVTMLALGLEDVLQPNSYWTTDTFNIIVLVGGFIAAIVGGVVCVAIARTAKATIALLAIVLIFGVGSAAMNVSKPDPPARTGEAAFEDIATHGKEPVWFAFGKVVSAMAGVLIGSALVSRRPVALSQTTP